MTSTTAPSSTAPPPGVDSGSGGAGPLLITRTFDGAIGYEGREPTTIGFSRDSSNVVSHLTWSAWGPTTAVGRGSLGVDSCQPGCAAGTVTQVPVTVDLSAVLDGHFTAKTEKGGTLVRSYSYPSAWAASAS